MSVFIKEVAEMYFKEWILKRYQKNSPYAELAQFVHDDADFPESNAKVLVIAHLRNMNVYDQFSDIFEKAWKMFRAAERNRTLPYYMPKK